eukprot:IDg15434t1
MIAWYFLALDYEKREGSLATLYNTFVLIVPVAAVLHIASAYLFDFVLRFKLKESCAVGISGVLFALFVISLETTTSVSIFGFFNMPAFWYPIALALVLQLFSPGLSFLGHLAGIAAGHVIISGVLSFAMLSSSTISAVENKLKLRSLPHWRVRQDYLTAIGIGSRGGGTESPTVGGAVSSARQSVSQWFSSGQGQQDAAGATGSVATRDYIPREAAFTGAGNVVGGQRLGADSSGARVGVPPQSRLLAAAPRQPPPVLTPENGENETGADAV